LGDTEPAHESRMQTDGSSMGVISAPEEPENRTLRDSDLGVTRPKNSRFEGSGSLGP
jgi:hypothetical protein